jgi:hypothetical protein
MPSSPSSTNDVEEKCSKNRFCTSGHVAAAPPLVDDRRDREVVGDGRSSQLEVHDTKRVGVTTSRVAPCSDTG